MRVASAPNNGSGTQQLAWLRPAPASMSGHSATRSQSATAFGGPPAAFRASARWLISSLRALNRGFRNAKHSCGICEAAPGEVRACHHDRRCARMSEPIWQTKRETASRLRGRIEPPSTGRMLIIRDIGPAKSGPPGTVISIRFYRSARSSPAAIMPHCRSTKFGDFSLACETWKELEPPHSSS